MIDVVFPNKNEAEFIEMAERLGISGLILVYKNKNEFYNKKTKIPTENALLVEPKDVRKVHDSKALAICTASREALERGADIVYGFELQEVRDPTHFRASGLNQVLCKIATNKKVKIGFSFASILGTMGQKRSILLGRIMQNIIFCRKFKTPMRIASFATEPYQMRAEAEMAAFFRQLGMQDVQKALK